MAMGASSFVRAVVACAAVLRKVEHLDHEHHSGDADGSQQHEHDDGGSRPHGVNTRGSADGGPRQTFSMLLLGFTEHHRGACGQGEVVRGAAAAYGQGQQARRIYV